MSNKFSLILCIGEFGFEYIKIPLAEDENSAELSMVRVMREDVQILDGSVHHKESQDHYALAPEPGGLEYYDRIMKTAIQHLEHSPGGKTNWDTVHEIYLVIDDPEILFASEDLLSKFKLDGWHFPSACKKFRGKEVNLLFAYDFVGFDKNYAQIIPDEEIREEWIKKHKDKKMDLFAEDSYFYGIVQVLGKKLFEKVKGIYPSIALTFLDPHFIESLAKSSITFPKGAGTLLVTCGLTRSSIIYFPGDANKLISHPIPVGCWHILYYDLENRSCHTILKNGGTVHDIDKDFYFGVRSGKYFKQFSDELNFFIKGIIDYHGLEECPTLFWNSRFEFGKELRLHLYEPFNKLTAHLLDLPSRISSVNQLHKRWDFMVENKEALEQMSQKQIVKRYEVDATGVKNSSPSIRFSVYKEENILNGVNADHSHDRNRFSIANIFGQFHDIRQSTSKREKFGVMFVAGFLLLFTGYHLFDEASKVRTASDNLTKKLERSTATGGKELIKGKQNRQRVLWGDYLASLSEQLPNNIWLTDMAVSYKGAGDQERIVSIDGISSAVNYPEHLKEIAQYKDNLSKQLQQKSYNMMVNFEKIQISKEKSEKLVEFRMEMIRTVKSESQKKSEQTVAANVGSANKKNEQNNMDSPTEDRSQAVVNINKTQ
ncbi:PilN domain-containing protein [Candidatus Magnetaquicoccus inordinatus]|uniref:PilN domain-containing protein n=1 Tax=Candidatus Magnetaquicoccus inordinatus TaxID=2496818 RepID=UPI00102BA686|nr:PilN domain-containing protein [Candidatus Magnetaquicoccus inordinatus]